MTVTHAQASSIEIDKTLLREQTATPTNAQNVKFGIKAKLFLAFFSLAALTALASAVAWYVFRDIDRAVARVTLESIPGIIAALSAAEKSAEIAAAAPALMAVGSQDERVSEETKLEERADALVALINTLISSGVPPEKTLALSKIERETTTKIKELNSAVEKRLRLETERLAGIRLLSSAQADFLIAIEPLIDDSVFNLVTKGEDVTAENTRATTELVEGNVSKIDQLFTINAESNLAAGLLTEAAHVSDPALLQPIRERFLAAAATIDRRLQLLRGAPETTPLRERLERLLALGTGADSMFDIRERTLRMASGQQRSLEPNEHQLSLLKTAHESLLLTLVPMIDDAAFDLVLATEKATTSGRRKLTELIDVSADLLQLLLTLRAEGTLAVGVLQQAADTSNVTLLQPLNERFIAAKEHIEQILKQLPLSLDSARVQKTTLAMIDVGKGENGMFVLRRAELQQIAAAQSALAGSRALASQLGGEIASLVAAAQSTSNAAASQAAQAITKAAIFMTIITIVSILGALAVMLYFVMPRIIRPLESITKAMTVLAGGDTSVDIPGRMRTDELGRMAQALGVFRDTAIEVQKTNLKEIAEARRRLSVAIESISEAFSLYDGEDRLVACNSMYRTLIFPDVADDSLLGTTFETLIRLAAERGDIEDAKGRLEDWVRERLLRHRNPSSAFVQQRRDGRWVIVSERKTDDGGTVAVYSDVTELKQREEQLSIKTKALEQLSNQLAKYLSPQVYESIFTGRSNVTVASRRKKLTIFFSDLEGFTETTERLESEDLTQLLNHYLTEMSKIALQFGGTIDKYVGDAVLIFFGDPETKGVKADAVACVKMAIAMRKKMHELDSVWRASGIEKPPRCRTGINTGFCTVGNFGSEDRMDYTIIGSGVNLARRLEQMSPPGEILISYETYALVKDEICCEERGHINVKGISHSVATYQVVDVYENVASTRDLIHEVYGTLKLDIDLEAMSANERTHALAILQRAVDRLSCAKQTADPSIAE
jgi:class 3 adenylate cyclase/phosphoglycerate-specific signal transduction histidine kinase